MPWGPQVPGFGWGCEAAVNLPSISLGCAQLPGSTLQPAALSGWERLLLAGELVFGRLPGC